MVTPVNQQPLPPVPTQSGILAKEEGNSNISQPWNQWFIGVRTKINLINATIASLSNITLTGGAIPISAGGTGATTAFAAFNNLSPLTTTGDMLVYNSGNVRLPIGTNGQVLSIVSGLPTWTTFTGGSPLTTKGDLYTFTTVNARLPVGSDGQVLVANSANPTGLGWATNSPTLPLTTKGDILTYNGGLVRLGVGSDGQVLTSRSGATNGVDWETPSTGISFGTYASRPVSPVTNQVYYCTDLPIMLLGNSGSWIYRYDGMIIVPPSGVPGTWLNQGTATYQSNGPFDQITAPSVSGANLRIRQKTLAFSSNYTVTALLSFGGSANNYNSCGLVLSNSSNNLATIQVTGFNTNTPGGSISGAQVSFALSASKYTSPTVATSAYFTQSCVLNSTRLWFRIVDDGTNRIYKFSTDGIFWITLYSVSRTDFLTPINVGWFSDSENTATIPVNTSLLSFQETSP